jgi:hypothetical protein
MHLSVTVLLICATLAFALIHRAASSSAVASPPHQAYVRVVRDNGVWWFQDGYGQRFFSLGVNCVGGCYGHAEDTPISPARKAGIVARLKDWGFNTAACWSSPSVWNDLYVADQIYTEFRPHEHDVFDESFWRGAFLERLRHEVKPFLGQKNFIGYFLDNEPEWDAQAQAIFVFYLSLSKARPGSRAFVSHLKTWYQGSIRRLNREWGTAYAGFNAIPGSPPPPHPATPLLKAWRTQVAATYYRRYAALVRALDPHHLLLGIRYRGVPDGDLFKALSPYFDVNSINDYNRYGHLKPAYAALYKATGKPLMITEFSFSGFPHPGSPSALFVEVYSQEHRGLGYHKYVRQAARAPFMVGMHWFMWMDYAPQAHAAGGYPYPPDQNVGLLSHDETVLYEDLGRWVTRTNAEVEAAHRAARAVADSAPGPERRALPRFVPTVDGELGEWPKALAIRPSHVTSLVDGVPIDLTYFISWDTPYLYLAADISDAHLAHPHKDQDWVVREGDHVSIALRPATSPDRRGDAPAAVLLFPMGQGPDNQQPYAVRRDGLGGYQQIPLRVAKHLRPGGYTIEAAIPAAAVPGFQAVTGTSWNISVSYQNVDHISQASWEGTVTLQR